MHPGNLSRIQRLVAMLALASCRPTVGGQAVMEGVMMRNMHRLAVAVRKPDGSIQVKAWPWFSLTHKSFLKKPFVRGFPVLLETLVNGIKALNYSATEAADESKGEEIKTWHLVLTLVVAIGMALALFVVVPHLFSLGIAWIGLGGGAETLSFHVWDGFFKLSIFLAYIAVISFLPDIRRVFEYHGAEHKIIWAFESSGQVEPLLAQKYSRLHPRCGTTFLLFVLSLSIILHAVVVPLMLLAYSPASGVLKHAYIVGGKFLLMIPISAIAYELIKFSGKFSETLPGRIISCPGLMLQRMTTKEPDASQLEVAAAALASALECTDEGPAGEVI